MNDNVTMEDSAIQFNDVVAARDIYKAKLKRGITIGVVVSLVISLLFAFGNGYSASSFLMGFIFAFFNSALFIGLVCTLILFFSTQKLAKKYKSTYKAYFVRTNLEKTFTDIQYRHDAGIARDAIKETQMINTGDRYTSNDYTTGKYKDVVFTQADVEIQIESTDSDGNTHYVTIFKGRIMFFAFPKKFNFRLEVVEKGFGANLIPGKNKTTGRKLQKTELESSEFNKLFKTYAEDGFEAFYLLDPAFMNNILELENEYKGKILLGFFDNKLMVALKNGKDSFEPPSAFKKLDENVEMEKITREMRIITDFVDKLKLNNKLFK